MSDNKNKNISGIIIGIFVIVAILCVFFFGPKIFVKQAKQEIYTEAKKIGKEISHKIENKTGINVSGIVQNMKEKRQTKLENNDNNNTGIQQANASAAKPKGNKEIFCTQNTYKGVMPTISSGYGNDLLKLCYSGYGALYKHGYNISLYTVEKLSPAREELAKDGEREQTFYPDPVVQATYGDAVRTEDYIGASDGGKIRYDRGHLAPSRDMPLDDRFESFYLSNIVPQSANNNRNVWAHIEKTARCLAVERNTDVYVVNVPVIDINYYKNNKLPLPVLHTRHGLDINIPDYMAKGIYIPQTNEIGVYLTKNDDSKTNYKLISVNDLKKLSYIDIFPQIQGDLKDKITNFPKPGKCK